LYLEGEEEMFGARQTSNPGPTLYATAADFRQIFEKDMDRLYLLSLLLTADPTMAEECFVRGLDASSKGNRVFKEWLDSWAKRVIVRNAIRIIRPRPGASGTANHTAMNQPPEFSAVIGLPSFERFTFVLSVLERYSDQECSLLLNCSRSEVIAARVHALESIGKSAEHPCGQANAGSHEHAPASA
jgi:hypothetical protein